MPVLIFLNLDFENKPTFSTYFLVMQQDKKLYHFLTGIQYFSYFCTQTI